jgi:hypothetical protein
MNKISARIGAMAAFAATVAATALLAPTASAAPPILPLAECPVGAIPFASPLTFVQNSDATAINAGVNTGDVMGMIGAQSVNTQLGELDGRKYTLTLILVDQAGTPVSESSFVDRQPISIPLPAFVGTSIVNYTVEAEITLPTTRAGLGCYSKLALQNPKSGVLSPTLANVKVVPLCTATPRFFNLGGASVVGQPYTHVFNASTVGSGPLNVDITRVGGLALAAPVQVAIGNSVSYTPQSPQTVVNYRTYLGATWEARECWRETFTYEIATTPVAPTIAVPTRPVTIANPGGENPQRPRRTRTSPTR